MSGSADLRRRDFMQATLAAGLTVLGGNALAACGGGEEVAQSQTKLTGHLAAHEFSPASTPTQQAFETIEHIGRVLGLKAERLSYDADPSKELAQVDQMGTLGVTAMQTLIIDNGVTRQIAEACIRNDVYMSARAQLGVWILPNEPEIDWHYQGLGTTNDGAYALCVTMFEELGGKGNFVFIDGPPGSTTTQAKGRAVERALEEYPNIKLVARQRGNADREKSRTVLDSILTSTQGRVDAVYCINDDSALGALSALEEKGIEGVLVSGADAAPEAVDRIIAGTMFGTEAINVPFASGFCAIQALDAANGHRPRPLEGLLVQDLLLLDTPDAAREYKRILAEGPATLDYSKMSRVLHPDNWDPQWPVIAISPEEYWAKDIGIPKPGDYTIPDDYARAATPEGFKKLNELYAAQTSDFKFAAVVEKSRTGKTALQVGGRR